MFQDLFNSRLRLLAGAGIICGALAAGTIGGAIAAPPLASTPTATAVTNPKTTPNGNSGTSTTQGNPGQQKPWHGGPGPNRFGRRGWGGPGPAGFGNPQAMLQPLAQLFNITPQDLRQQLSQGQTLAQIAQAHGKTASDVKTLLLNDLKTRLDAAVKNGRITSQQETTMLTNAGTRIDQLINANLSNAGHPGNRGPFVNPAIVNGVAQFLGITPQQLRQQLQSGQTLAQIIQSHGKTTADAKTAMETTLKNDLAQRDAKILQQADSSFDNLLNQNLSKPAPKPTATATPTA